MPFISLFHTFYCPKVFKVLFAIYFTSIYPGDLKDKMDTKKLTVEQKEVLKAFDSGGRSRFEDLVERSGLSEKQVSEVLDELIEMRLVRETG